MICSPHPPPLISRKWRRGRHPRRWLIIGYGNLLRGDDAVGARVVTALARRRRPGLRTIVATQLTPELASELARAQRVIFVDARAGGGGIRLCRIEAARGDSAIHPHLSDPAALLALANLLYGQAPRAWLLSIPGQNFELGAPLAPQARRGRVQAIHRLWRVLQK